MKIVLLGSSKFSRLVGEHILNSQHEIVAIVTQPDKVNARNNKIIDGEMKVFANMHNIPIYQFESINRDGEEVLKRLNADIFVTASYGQIIKQNILDICPIINVHGSLLPKYRGSAPIQWAIINGEKETGVAIMRTERGLDCGEVYLSKKIDILDTDTFDTMFEKLGNLGGQAIVEFMDNFDFYINNGVKQNEGEMTYFPMLNKEMSRIDFNKPSDEIVNLIRGLSTCMTTYFVYNNARYKVLFASFYKGSNDNVIEQMNDQNIVAGTILVASAKQGLVIKTQNGAIEIDTIQPEGKKPMKAKDFCNSGKLPVGKVVNNEN